MSKIVIIRKIQLLEQLTKFLVGRPTSLFLAQNQFVFLCFFFPLDFYLASAILGFASATLKAEKIKAWRQSNIWGKSIYLLFEGSVTF